MLLKVKLISGERLDYEISESKFIVGRSPKCQVVIPHEGVSRQHVLIEIIDDEIFVTDLASTNGVAIDGERIQPSERARFQTFLTLSFGSVESLQINLDDDQKSSMEESNLDRYNKSKDTPNVTLQMAESRARSKAQKPDAKPKGPGKFIRAKEKKNLKPLITNALVIASLALAIYYFVSTKEETPNHPTEKSKSKNKNKDDEYF